MNISHILRKERSPYQAIHIFFWVITWIFAIWMFAYCNGWSVNLDVVRLLPQKSIGSLSTWTIDISKSPEFLERFWFALIDTQSDNISISLDHGELNKKIIQKKVPYGLHHVHIEWANVDSIDFDFDIQTDNQFIRRNFSLFGAPRLYKVWENTGERKEEALCLWIGRIYLQENRNCKQSQQYKYAITNASWALRLTNTNTFVLPLLANDIGFVSSWSITIPREYFGSDVFSLPDIHSWSIRHIFNYIGGSYVLTSSGKVLSLGRSKELPFGTKNQNIEYIQSIGGDLFVLNTTWSLTFYDELFRSVVIDHIFTGPIKIFVYEHAYIISTLNASYLYQPYEKDIKKIASGPLTNISWEILSFINDDNSIQKIILSPINPMK